MSDFTLSARTGFVWRSAIASSVVARLPQIAVHFHEFRSATIVVQSRTKAMDPLIRARLSDQARGALTTKLNIAMQTGNENGWTASELSRAHAFELAAAVAGYLPEWTQNFGVNVGPAGSIQMVFALPRVHLELTIEDLEPQFTAYAETADGAVELLNTSVNSISELMMRLDSIAGTA